MKMRLQVRATAMTWRPRPYVVRKAVDFQYLAIFGTLNDTRQIEDLHISIETKTET